MPIAIVCSKCSAKLNAPDAAAGKKVKCPKCHAGMSVPTPSEESAFEVVEEEPVKKAAAPPQPVEKPKTQTVATSDDEDEATPRKNRVQPEAEDDEDTRKKRRATDDEDGHDERPQKKKTAAAGRPKMIPLAIGGVVVFGLVCVAGWVCYDQFIKKDDVGGNTKPPPPPVPPGSNPGPKQPDVPAPSDPYDIDWRDLPFDDNRIDGLRRKADEAIAALKKAGVRVDEIGYDVQLSTEAGTSEGTIRPEILQKLRVAGVMGIKTTWKDWQLSDTGMLQLGQLRCLTGISIREGTFTDSGLAGLKDLPSLGALDLAGTEEKALAITGEGFRHLTASKKLTNVSVWHAGITNNGLAQIGQVGSVERLILGHTKIADAGLVHLKGLKKLTDLSIDSSEISGTGCQELSSLPALKELSLVDCPITDDGVASIAGLNVQKITLARTKVTDAAATSLAKMTALKSVSLFDNGVTDVALRALAQRPSLEFLWLQEPAVTDAGLLALAECPKLRHLNLKPGPKITDGGIEKLKKAKPELKLNLFD